MPWLGKSQHLACFFDGFGRENPKYRTSPAFFDWLPPVRCLNLPACSPDHFLDVLPEVTRSQVFKIFTPCSRRGKTV